MTSPFLTIMTSPKDQVVQGNDFDNGTPEIHCSIGGV